MNGARDFACRNVRAALGLERAGLAVMLACEVDHRAVLREPVAGLAGCRVDRLDEDSLEPTRLFEVECGKVAVAGRRFKLRDRRRYMVDARRVQLCRALNGVRKADYGGVICAAVLWGLACRFRSFP